MAKQARVLIADDHGVIRSGLRALLGSRWRVVGEAADGREAVRLAAKLEPDVAIVDLTMPDLNGIDTTRQILQVSRRTKVLIFTVHDSEETARQALEAGACGYLLKTSTVDELAEAVTAVLEGRTFFRSHAAMPASEAGRAEMRRRLTPREREVVQLVAEGKSTKQVAGALGISVKTADTHRVNVMRKLGVHSVTELVRYAVRNRIIEP